jgi:hypothetical protein
MNLAKSEFGRQLPYAMLNFASFERQLITAKQTLSQLKYQRRL